MAALNARASLVPIASPLQWRIAPGLVAPGLALALICVLAGAVAVLSAAARWHDWPVPETAFRLAAGLAVSGMVVAAALALPYGGLRRLAGCPGWAVALGCVGCAALAAMIARFAFGGFASSADEYGFLFAAETLLRGRVANAIPPDPGLVQQVYLIARDGRWASQYMPGWPAILAAFGEAGLPTWLGAPACALGMLGLLARAAWRVTARAEITGGVVLACAASPFVLLNAATYFSHCASALFAVGAVLAQIAANRRRDDSRRDWCRQDWRCHALAGVCLGALLLCRIDSLLVAGSGVFCAWAARPGRVRALAAYAAGAAPFVLAFALYNLAVTGNPLTPPTVWGGNLSIGAGGLAGVEPSAGHWRALVQTAWRASDLADTTTLVIPALYAWALLRAVRRRALAFYDVIPLAAFALFLVFPDYGGWQMGPRYWFDGFVVMHLTVAREIASSLEPWRTRLIALLALLVPAQLAMLPPQVGFHARMMAERAAPFRLAAALRGPAFVMVGDFPSGFDARFNRHNIHRAQDFMRNGPDLADPARRERVLFVRADAPYALARACRLRPGVPGYLFSLGPADPRGRLTKLACPPP